MSGRRDYILIKAWMAGNRVPGEKLINETYKKVFDYVSFKISASTPNRQELIEDIVNEAFIRAFKKIDEFNGKCLFFTWICGFANNCIKEKWKELKRLPIPQDFSVNEASEEDDDFLAPESEISDFGNPERIIISKEEYEAVWAAFLSLREDYREIIKLRLIVGLRFNEISDRLNKKVDNLESLFRRAIKALKNEFVKNYKNI